ncbi:MAG: anti-sigma factor domain-containing protein [Desulfitobacterium hafniense]|nr:anti-sigma factor domain-containing protein [Desulfitobacterium hafniense]
MSKIQGIVMRTSIKRTVVLTEKGEFLEIPTPKVQPFVGQKIEVELKPSKGIFFNNALVRQALAAAVLLLAISIIAFYQLFIPTVAVASVALDINKGMEILINKNGKVISIRDVNGSSSIFNDLSVKGLDVYEAVTLILEKANAQGLLKEDQNLILASVIPSNEKGSQVIDTEKLKSTLQDNLHKEKRSGSIVVGKVDSKMQQEAKQQGMTVNSYWVYDRCQENGVNIAPEAFKDGNVQKALNDANADVSKLFPTESIAVQHSTQQSDENYSKDQSSSLTHESPSYNKNHNDSSYEKYQNPPTYNQSKPSNNTTAPSSSYPGHETPTSPTTTSPAQTSPQEPQKSPYHEENDDSGDSTGWYNDSTRTENNESNQWSSEEHSNRNEKESW